MNNEIILLIIALVDLTLIFFSFRFGKEGLTGVIVVNIVLVSTFGSQLVPVFGFLTNAGNVFYASIFLAMNMIIELYENRDARRVIWVGFMALVLFIIMGQFVIRMHGAPESLTINDSIATLFHSVPRVAFASICAYLVAQYINLWLYRALKSKHRERLLWLRNITSTSAAQIVDSVLFFSIAFLGLLPLHLIIQSILIGTAIKILVALLSTPFLYLARASGTADIAGE